MQTGETATTEGGAGPARPADRYGSAAKTAPKRWRRWAFLAIALVVSFAVAWIAYVNLGQASIDAERVAFEARPGNAMQVTINVTRDDPDKPGVCIVRVRDKSGAESGRKEVLVPAGAGHSRVSTVVKSIDLPVTADVYGCSYSIPRYMSTP
ncbi:MAG TPA: DUF4307 domain-containing protein [Amycolatopsis sp.]|nr:DUF4307 domain-containing protein [Amycolatopsis sp.]